jgi:DNA-binding GntR family transcriptional regulator
VGVIDRDSDRALYRQLADLLRGQIASGELAPGTPLPAEVYLAQTHDLSRTAVRRAIELLLNEGLVSKSRGRRTMVRLAFEREVVPLGHGDQVDTRMPTEDERRQLGAPVGEPVFVVRRAAGRVDMFRGASTTLAAP